MKPTDAGAALDQAVAGIKAASGVDTGPLLRAAKEAAAATREAASHAGDSISIRMIEKPHGLRVTVTGRRAAKYRAVLQQMLDSHLPGARAEIRAQITQKAK